MCFQNVTKRSVKRQPYNYLIYIINKGDHGCGKTALAVQIAKDSGFPFVKVLSAKKMIGLNESAKCHCIKEVNRLSILNTPLLYAG